MADFRLWGRIEQLGPSEFFVVVSAVELGDPEGAQAFTRMTSSREAALAQQRYLLVEVGAAIAARGGHVIDVETD